MDGATLKFVDKATELFIPRRFDFALARIEASKQLLRQTRTILW